MPHYVEVRNTKNPHALHELDNLTQIDQTKIISLNHYSGLEVQLNKY